MSGTVGLYGDEEEGCSPMRFNFLELEIDRILVSKAGDLEVLRR